MIKLSTALVVLFAHGFVLVSPSPADDGWRIFQSREGSFRIEMPGAPTTTTKKRGLPIARFTSKVHKTYRGDSAFGVNVTEIPRTLAFIVPRRTIVDRARSGFLEDANAREISYDDHEIDGTLGKKLEYNIPGSAERPDQRGVAWFSFERNRLMIFYAEVDPTVPDSDVERYFESIRFSKKR